MKTGFRPAVPERRDPQGLRQLHRAKGIDLASSSRASSSASWAPVGLRQDHAAAHHRRAGGADRAHQAGRARHLALPPAAARLRHRVPVVRAVSQPHVADNVAYGLVNRAPRAQAGGATGAELLRWWPARQRAKFPAPAVRRPAAAHRAGARAGHVARAAAAGRAAVGAGCHGARAAARRDPQPAAAKLGVTTIMVTHDQEERCRWPTASW